MTLIFMAFLSTELNFNYKMTSGSSNIDPNEFNDSLENDLIVDGQSTSTPQMRTSQMQTVRNRRRRSRRSLPATPTSTRPCRIRIYQTINDPTPNRQALNRIIFAIARALRHRRSVVPGPGARPGVVYHRNNDSIDIEVILEE